MERDTKETQLERANEIIFNVKELKIACKIHLKGEGNNIAVCLHGWLDNAASFDTLAPLLNFDRVYCLDLSGHGLSQHRPEFVFDYPMAEWALEVAYLIMKQKWENVTLIGHSLGAGISTLAAGLLPNQVQRLVLLDGGLLQFSDPADSPVNLKKSLDDALSENARPVKKYSTFESLVSARLLKGSLQPPTAVTLLNRGAYEIEDGNWHVRSDPRLKNTSPVRFTYEQIFAFIKNVKCSTLLINSTDISWGRSREQLHETLAAFQSLQRIHIEGNHYIHFEKAPEVAGHINKWIKNE